jgi:hypothetical protein
MKFRKHFANSSPKKTPKVSNFSKTSYKITKMFSHGCKRGSSLFTAGPGLRRSQGSFRLSRKAQSSKNGVGVMVLRLYKSSQNMKCHRGKDWISWVACPCKPSCICAITASQATDNKSGTQLLKHVSLGESASAALSSPSWADLASSASSGDMAQLNALRTKSG